MGIPWQHGLDARHLSHIPPHVPTPPYTVLRTRDTFPLVSPTTSGDRTVALIGEFTDTSRGYPNVVPRLAVYGTGAAAPGTAADSFTSCADVAAIGAGNAHLRLHALTVTIQADAAALSATGRGYFGVMPGNINRAGFASWNAIAATIIARVQAKQFTAYQSLGEHPPTFMSYPMDATQWGTFDLLEGAPAVAANTRQSDVLAPMAIVLMDSGTATTYQVTVCAEWRVIFTLTDARASLHEKHPTTPANHVDKVVTAASDASGDATSSGISPLMAATAISLGAAGAGLAGVAGRQELRRTLGRGRRLILTR